MVYHTFSVTEFLHSSTAVIVMIHAPKCLSEYHKQNLTVPFIQQVLILSISNTLCTLHSTHFIALYCPRECILHESPALDHSDSLSSAWSEKNKIFLKAYLSSYHVAFLKKTEKRKEIWESRRRKVRVQSTEKQEQVPRIVWKTLPLLPKSYIPSHLCHIQSVGTVLVLLSPSCH